MTGGVLHLRCSRGFYGAERVILDLARTCVAQGVPSALACIVDAREPHRELAEAARGSGLATWELESRGRLDPATLLALVRLLRELRPQILHLHGYKAQLLGWLAHLAAPLPLVSTHHGDTAEGLAVRAYEALGRRLLTRCERVIAVSAEGERLLRAQAPGLPVVQIPNGVDAAGIAARAAAAADLRLRLGLQGSVVVLGIGRLSPEKGQAVLIEAVAGMPEPRPVVVLPGEGPLRDELERLARRRGVRLLLPGYQQDLAPWWRLADLLCQPSHREGLPLAVLESMAAGLPVVASAVGELPQVLGAMPGADGDAEAGLLVPPGDAAALGRALQRLLGPDNAPKRQAAAAAARRRAAQLYGLQAVVRRTIDEVYLPLAPLLVHDDDHPTGAPRPPGEAPDGQLGASR